MMTVELFCGDCLENHIADQCVDLCFVDPPYNIGIFKKVPPGEYLAWCEQWIAECSRVLVPNGAFWVSHKNPRILGCLADMIEMHGRGLINWITWDKYNQAGSQQGFLDGYTVIEELRSFQVMAEYLIYHADEGQWTTKCDQGRGFIFEPLRAWFQSERKRACLTFKDINNGLGLASCGGGMASHYFGNTFQWELPTQELYISLQKLFNRGNGDEYLRREYEDLRREYEGLRYTFNNPGLESSVWQIPPAPKNGHPTPKPLELLERIILTTSNEGDVVFDPMMGRGVTGEAAMLHGRSFIGIELDRRHFDYAKRRIEAAQNAMIQLELEVSYA